MVTGVSFVGSPASGDTYELGETIEVTVKFHRFIKHSGTPQVELTVGGQTALASFDHGRGRGSGVTELYFEYDVQADDFDADGVAIAADAIRLNGGYVRAASDSTLDADLGHAQVADDATRKVDGAEATGPTVTEVRFSGTPARGNAYRSGETIRVQMWFDRLVTVSGSPYVELTVGAQVRRAALDSTSDGVRGLGFAYAVQARDSDADGVSVAADAIRLNGGAINATDGATDALPTHAAVADDGGHRVDGSEVTAPAVDRVAITSRPRGGATYVLGEAIVVQVRFSEPVTVTGPPRLALGVGGATRGAVLVRSDDRGLWFRYRVRDGDRDHDGIAIAAGALSLNGGAIRDRDRNTARLGLGSHAITSAAGHLVDASLRDTTPPSVSGVAVTSTPRQGGAYVFGKTVVVEVRFSEPVTVPGSPRLALTVGGSGRSAVYAACRLLVVRFHYVVADGDRGALSVADGALNLNGGAILDAADNAAVLALGSAAGALGASVHGLRRDEDPPAVRSVAFESTPPGGDTYERGDIVQAAVQFSEPVTVTGQPRLALTVGGTVCRGRVPFRRRQPGAVPLHRAGGGRRPGRPGGGRERPGRLRRRSRRVRAGGHRVWRLRPWSRLRGMLW